MEEYKGFFHKEAWKGVVVAIIAVVAVQLALSWQYYRLEEKRLPLIEQQLAQQQEELEKQKAKEAIEAFLNAWAQGNQDLAMRFLTENAVVQLEQEGFLLTTRFFAYNIVKIEKIQQGAFRVQVEKRQAEGLPLHIEILRAVKILDSYYIDSLEIAG
jgi:hypothetical protein